MGAGGGLHEGRIAAQTNLSRLSKLEARWALIYKTSLFAAALVMMIHLSRIQYSKPSDLMRRNVVSNSDFMWLAAAWLTLMFISAPVARATTTLGTRTPSSTPNRSFKLRRR